MSKEILVIDDSEVIRKMIEVSLQDMDINITEAEDGEIALEKLNKTRFDLIITDINMPNLDGLGVIEAIKNHSENKFAKVCVLTTETEQAKKEQAKALGASAFLTKPFDPDTLRKSITKLII